MIHEALFVGLATGSAVTILNCVEPQFVDAFVRQQLIAVAYAVASGNERVMVDYASRIAGIINERFIKPNFGRAKNLPILACSCTEEEPFGNQLMFQIPISGESYLSIKWRRDSILLRWPAPVMRELGHLMARLVYGNDMIGTVRVMSLRKDTGGRLQEDVWELSYRAALIACTMGSDLCGPIIDMASDGLLEDYGCVSSTSPRALGLKKKSRGVYLEL